MGEDFSEEPDIGDIAIKAENLDIDSTRPSPIFSAHSPSQISANSSTAVTPNQIPGDGSSQPPLVQTHSPPNNTIHGRAHPYSATSDIHTRGHGGVGGDSDHHRQQKRRPHTKSRNGCMTCKRRRVKCDETRPVCRNCTNLRLECRYASTATLGCADLQIMNLRLLHHYVCEVAQTIASSGISTLSIWQIDVPEMGFKYPFLMHAILMFSATHLAQVDPKTYGSVVTQHRGEALSLLRSEVQKINGDNVDALVAASVLLILDAMANAAPPAEMVQCSLPASTWLHHVRGAATILLALGTLPPTSKFYAFMGIDLLDLANCVAPHNAQGFSSMRCFTPELADLYPVHLSSPYYPSLAFLDKLLQQRMRPDFILRVFSFPALMDGKFVQLLARGDTWARRIVAVYYSLVRSYCNEMKGQLWFLQGVSKVLPIDTDSKFGGLGFVNDALPVSQSVDSILARFDASFAAANNEAEAAMFSMLDIGAENGQNTRRSAASQRRQQSAQQAFMNPNNLPQTQTQQSSHPASVVSTPVMGPALGVNSQVPDMLPLSTYTSQDSNLGGDSYGNNLVDDPLSQIGGNTLGMPSGPGGLGSNPGNSGLPTYGTSPPGMGVGIMPGLMSSTSRNSGGLPFLGGSGYGNPDMGFQDTYGNAGLEFDQDDGMPL